MRSTLDRYREAVRDEHDCSHLDFCSDCSFVYGLVQQLKDEGYIQCVECGEWAKSETDYCSPECEAKDVPGRWAKPREQSVDLVGMAKSVLGVRS